MRKITILVILIFVAFPFFMFAASARSVVWMKSESDHFIYLYHTEVASVVTEVVDISEETYKELSEFYNYKPEEKIILILKGYEDYSNGYAFSSGKVVIITLGDFYPYRVDDYWLKTVISHELGHVFQLGMVNDFLRAIRPFISRYLTPNALQPLWMSEGFAQFSSEIMKADSYDYRRLPYLVDGLSNDQLFSDDAINNGRSPIGYEAAYNYGYAFIDFLVGYYGQDKLVEFLKYKSGIRGIFGIDTAFREVYGKTYEELKAEFLQKMANEYSGTYNKLQPLALTTEMEEILKLSVDNDRLFYTTLDRRRHLYHLYFENTLLYSSAYPIVDFDINGNSIGLILLERDNEGSQTRLYIFDISKKKLKRTSYEHILRVQLLNENTAIVVENKFNVPTLELLFMDKGNYEVLFAPPDQLFSISQISLSPGARFLAIRANDKGSKYLLFYDFLKHSMVSYLSTGDFSIGSWENGCLLVASERGMGSQLFSIDPETGQQFLLASFPRSALWPVVHEGIFLITSQKEGFKIFEALPEPERELSFFERKAIRRKSNEKVVEGEFYKPLKHLRFETLFPYFLGAGLYFEDYLATTSLSVAAGYNSMNNSPKISFQLKSMEYYPMDVEFKLLFTGIQPDFRCELKTPNLFDGPFYLKAGMFFSFIPGLFGSYIDLGYVDSTELIGGKGMFKNFIKIKDVQSSVNTMELSGSISVEWENESLQLAIGTKARAILFGNPGAIDFNFGSLVSEEKLALGANFCVEALLGSRDFDLFNLLYFFEQGIGGKLSFLFDAKPIQFSLTLYKFESLNLYGSYPVKLSFGFSIENLKLKPYFNLSF